MTESSIPVPSTEACRTVQEWVFANTPDFIANHSLRSYRFARVLAPKVGLPESDLDVELLHLSCVLHDVGLTDHANGTERFEVDGADFAKSFVLERGLSTDRAQTVWEAVALHTTSSIASRMGPEIRLANVGIGTDVFGHRHELLTEAEVDDVHAGLPRLDLGRRLFDEVVNQVVGCASKAPAATFPAELAAQRGAIRSRSFDELLDLSPWSHRD
jgi:hypothetical protein